MSRKVRLTDYNQRIEVPQGAALFLEGGDIVVDGEIGSEGDSLGIVGGKPGFAPGGGGGGFSPTITDPQDGDIIARVGGAWVNNGNRKIGAVVEFYGWTFTPDGGGNAGGGLTFADPGNSAIYWSNGLTVADDNDGFVVTVKGRYRLTGTVMWEPSTGDTQILTAGVSPSNGEGTPPIVVPATGSLSVKPSASVNVLTEINVGGRIRFSCAKLCASGPYVLYDSYFHVQYEGPAASL